MATPQLKRSKSDSPLPPITVEDTSSAEPRPSPIPNNGNNLLPLRLKEVYTDLIPV